MGLRRAFPTRRGALVPSIVLVVSTACYLLYMLKHRTDL